MKELVLVRHAKSSWDYPHLTDRERPLNKRGRRDAPVMATRLADSDAEVERLVASPAMRTMLTAKAFSWALLTDEEEIIEEPQLYHADEEDWFEVVARQPEHIDTVAFFGHNPGLTYFLNWFLEDPLDNVPTCGLARLQFEVESWDQIEDSEPVRVLYSIPKGDGWEQLS